jgi:hypothetical protein
MAKGRKRRMCCRIDESIVQELEQMRDKTGLPVSKLVELRQKGFTVIAAPQKKITLDEMRQMDP